MGIYIKGMEMPKNCRECFACKAELSQEKKVIYVCCFAMADCPLVHVPEHGRLVDADRLLSERMKRTYYHLPNGDTAIPIIDVEYAPTVISADHEEEEMK